MKKRSELFFRLILIPLDYTMLVVSFALAFLLRHEQNKPLAYLVSGQSFLRTILPLLLAWLGIFAIAGLYDLRASRSRFAEIARVTMTCAAGVLSLIIIDFFTTKPILPSKAIPIYAFVLAVILVNAARLVVYFLQHYMFRFGIGVHNTIILGRGSSRIGFE